MTSPATGPRSAARPSATTSATSCLPATARPLGTLRAARCPRRQAGRRRTSPRPTRSDRSSARTRPAVRRTTRTTRWAGCCAPVSRTAAWATLWPPTERRSTPGARTTTWSGSPPARRRRTPGPTSTPTWSGCSPRPARRSPARPPTTRSAGSWPPTGCSATSATSRRGPTSAPAGSTCGTAGTTRSPGSSTRATRWVKHRYHAATRWVKHAYHAAHRWVKHAYHKARKWVAHKVHTVRKAIKKAYHRVKQAGKVVVARTARVVKHVAHKVKDAYNATEKWVKDHKNAIIEAVAIGGAILAGIACTAATAGAGAVGGKAAGFVAGKMGKLAGSVGGRMLSGAVSGGVGDAAYQLGTTGKVNLRGVAVSAGISAALGGVYRGRSPSGCTHSFDRKTKVLLASGATVAIANVKIGDRVKATDPRTGQTTPQTVVALHLNRDTDLTDLVVRNRRGETEVLHTTQHHPFWDASRKAWVDAKDLTASRSTLVAPDGGSLALLSVRNYTDVKEMHDLTVANVHTYYVVAAGQPALVHNCGDGGEGVSVTGHDLYVSGSKKRPEPAWRNGKEYELDGDGKVVPGARGEDGWPLGISTNTSPSGVPRNSSNTHLYRLPAGTTLPAGMKVVADGTDAGGPGPLGHHTFYPTTAVSPSDFRGDFRGLDGWENLGPLENFPVKGG